MSKMRIILLVAVVMFLAIGIIAFSIQLLPSAPTAPTATFPEGIDFPDERPVPRR